MASEAAVDEEDWLAAVVREPPGGLMELWEGDLRDSPLVINGGRPHPPPGLSASP